LRVARRLCDLLQQRTPTNFILGQISHAAALVSKKHGFRRTLPQAQQHFFAGMSLFD
jgi:hypothetical protein